MIYVSIFECWVLNRVPAILGDEPLVLDSRKKSVKLGSGDGNDIVIKEKSFSHNQIIFNRYKNHVKSL